MNNKNDTLKIALVRMRSEKGAIEENLSVTARYINEAEELGIDIIGFPEASITGYSDRGKFPETIISPAGPEVLAFLKLTEGKNVTVLAGIMEEYPPGNPFITQLVARNGRLVGFYRKITIIDEDADFITPGNETKVFRLNGRTFGIAICSDITNEEVFDGCATQGAEFVFELAAPGLYGEQATRDWEAGYKWWESVCLKNCSEYARKHNIWIGVATQAGRTRDEDFPGGGYLFSPKGERLYTTKDWQPGVAYLEIDFNENTVKELP